MKLGRVNTTLMITWREILLLKLGTHNVMENDDYGATQKKMDLPFYWLFYFKVLSLCDLFIFETYVIVTLYNFVIILDYLVLLPYLESWICKLLTYDGLIFTNCYTVTVSVIFICKWYGWLMVMIDLIYEFVYYLLMIDLI